MASLIIRGIVGAGAAGAPLPRSIHRAIDISAGPSDAPCLVYNASRNAKCCFQELVRLRKCISKGHPFVGGNASAEATRSGLHGAASTGPRFGCAESRSSLSSNSRRNSVRQVSARARKESGKQKLNKPVVSKECAGNPLPNSVAPAAEVPNRQQDLTTDGLVENGSLDQEGNQVDIPEFIHGVQARTSEYEMDIGAQLEKEATRNSLASQVPSSVEVDVDEVNPLREEYVDLLEIEESIQAEQLLKEEMAVKSRGEEKRVATIELAYKNSLRKNKIFFYPELPKVSMELEIFLNRSITTLADHPKVFINGAFNDWRWKPFVEELKKTALPGDWWSCKIEIPKEAYKVDLTFFDGQNTYENNSKDDFFILIEGGMMKEDFEYFLLEEETKAAQRRAEEEGRKERMIAEEHRLAEHRAAEAQDGVEAKRIMNEKRESARGALQKAVKMVGGLWFFDPSEFGGGGSATLYYNRSSRPLAFSKEIWIHGGSNNWEDMVSIVEKLSPAAVVGGDWWYAEVNTPEKAYMLNWVFADGPPASAQLYDNNDYQDFHAIVPKTSTEDIYWGKVEEEVYVKLRQETLAREAAAQTKVEHRERLKVELRAKTMKTFLQSQAHIFYTEPAEVQAGQEVAIFYNPSNTVLNGKPEVYIHGSFNRWTYRHGYFGCQKLTRADNGTHLTVRVKVPRDAYVMDFVFSERGGNDGGVYDNRNGLDYHVPIVGSTIRQPPMDIIHIALEMAPIAKVGGLGDVVTSLSRAIKDQGHNAEVVVPKYDCLNYKHIQDLQEYDAFYFGGTRVRVWNGKVEGLTVHFLEPENGIFWVGCIYGRRDDASRFGFFCHAALEFLRQKGRRPDIIHCHDWSSAPVAWLFQDSYKHDTLANARLVFTIHNLEFGMAEIGRAMASTHMATTVSPTYAREISGNPVIAPHWSKFHGIRNGIDPDIWDPYCDPFIPVGYTSDNVSEGKKAAKAELRHRLGLRQEDRPVLGIITRLTAQKGINLIKHGIWRTLERGGQVVLLGSAPDPRVQNEFVGLANQLNQSHGDMARLWLSYDEPLSHLIYAGADFILIPSIFEPCGLTQLTAMRYGAIPVVRQTGGLYDTVFDVDHDRDRARHEGIEPNGFSFGNADAAGLDYALNRALSSWYEAHDWFEELTKQVMQQDWTWNRPALDYIELYFGAKKLP